MRFAPQCRQVIETVALNVVEDNAVIRAARLQSLNDRIDTLARICAECGVAELRTDAREDAAIESEVEMA